MSLLDDVIGPDALDITLAGQSLNLDQVGPVTIRHGRQNLTSPPDAATCTLTVYTDALTDLPSIGDPLTVELGADASTAFGLAGTALIAARWRFTGRITDPAVRLPGADRPGTVTVTAASRRARLGNTKVGDTPWPAELDGARAARILAALPAGLAAIGAIDAGQRTVLARDVDRQAALGLLDALADDTGGQLVELRNGTLTWQDSEHRRTAVQLLTLDADNVLAPAAWVQELGGMVNDATVAYGAADPQDTVRITDTLSADPVNGLGPLEATRATQLALAGDATSLATLLVGRRSRPAWELQALTVDLLRTVTPAQAALLLQAEFASLLGVTGFPDTGPLTTSRLFLEGWTETVTRNAWRTTLLVSAYSRTGAPPRWQDVPAGLTWNDVPAGLSWLTAAGWEP